MNNINLLAIDIAKINFQLHGIDTRGNIMQRENNKYIIWDRVKK